MIVVFVLGIAALGTTVYLLIMYTSIPGAVDERLGSLEPLPDQLDRWVLDDASKEALAAKERGLKRETRVLHQPSKGLIGREYLVYQARLRDQKTDEILEVEAEVRSPRRRRRT